MVGVPRIDLHRASGVRNSPIGLLAKGLAVSGKVALWLFLLPAVVLAFGCGAINPGKPLWIQKSDPDVKYWLVKDAVLTPGSAYMSKEFFDHNMNDRINFIFTVVNEKGHYVAESRWIDPMDVEYRTIRTTHDRKEEGKRDFERGRTGTPRVHTISTKELFDHKPGRWNVELYIDGELARRIPFTVR